MADKTDDTPLDPGQIELRVYGLERVNNEEVPATIFADKLKALVAALRAADEAAYGRPLHIYTIKKLHTSQPTAILQERPGKSLYVSQEVSAIPAFEGGIEEISARAVSKEADAKFARAVANLTKGAGKQFAYGTVRSATTTKRLDDFLNERARGARHVRAFRGRPIDGWFIGASEASFEGMLQLIDTRGPLPQIKLTLSAGGKEVDCVCQKKDIEALGAQIDHRVRVFGLAIYDGSSGLPRRVEVRRIEPIRPVADIQRWAGAFHPFTEGDWDMADA